jgi:hypothetical protein
MQRVWLVVATVVPVRATGGLPPREAIQRCGVALATKSKALRQIGLTAGAVDKLG